MTCCGGVYEGDCLAYSGRKLFEKGSYRTRGEFSGVLETRYTR